MGFPLSIFYIYKPQTLQETSDENAAHSPCSVELCETKTRTSSPSLHLYLHGNSADVKCHVLLLHQLSRCVCCPLMSMLARSGTLTASNQGEHDAREPSWVATSYSSSLVELHVWILCARWNYRIGGRAGFTPGFLAQMAILARGADVASTLIYARFFKVCDVKTQGTPTHL